jgi:hypothetical protein
MTDNDLTWRIKKYIMEIHILKNKILLLTFCYLISSLSFYLSKFNSSYFWFFLFIKSSGVMHYSIDRVELSDLS